MLVVAQADDTPSPSSPSYQTASEASCLAECGLECIRFIRIVPLYSGCVAACGLSKCRHNVSSKAVYNCATNCAVSKSNNFNTGKFIFPILSFFF